MPIVYLTTGSISGWSVEQRVLFTAVILFLHISMWLRFTLQRGGYAK